MKSSDYLFVYGTLMSAYDGPYARLLRQHAELLGEAWCRGSLHRVSYYPGLVPQGSGVVWGEVYRLKPSMSEQLLSRLDAYEGIDNATLKGDEYVRNLVDIEMGTDTLRAWTYIYVGEAHGPPIIGGRFFPKQPTE